MTTVLLDLTILCTDTRVRGIGRYAAELALELTRLARGAKDLRVLFLERIGWSGGVHVTDDAALALARLDAPGRPDTGRWSWAYRCRLGIARAARRVRADVIHLPHTGATPLFDTGAARLVTCHDLIPLRYPDHYAGWRDGWGLGRRLLDARRYRSADHILAISEATAADLQCLLAVPASKITVVHHGIDRRRFRPEPDEQDGERLRQLGLAAGKPFLLYVGDGDWRKNHPVLFRALALARHEHSALGLVWAGRLSPARLRSIRADAARLGVREAVRLVGHVDDPVLFALYRRALATVMISRAEGFGLPVLEGMALGSPVITSSCSSLAEIAADGAALVDPDSPAEVAAAILALLRDPGRRQELRERGLCRAAGFTRERQARQTMALYRQLGERRPGPRAATPGTPAAPAPR